MKRVVRARIVRTIDDVLSGYFAHAPLKSAPQRARAGSASVRQVSGALARLARARELAQSDFEQGVLNAVTRLRDVHTGYTLSSPTNEELVYLPFLLRRYQDARRRERYVVVRVRRGSLPRGSKLDVGAEVTHWDGRAIGDAVEANGALEEGAHPEARRALGLAVLTSRWAGGSPKLTSRKVEVTFEMGGRRYVETFRWRNDMSVGPHVRNILQARDVAFPHLSMNRITRIEQLWRRRLFARPNVLNHHRVTLTPVRLDPRRFANRARFELDFEPMTLRCAHGEFAYVRIRSFDFDPAFVLRFMELLKVMPQDGLILDLRENPGGSIQNAEKMLQLLTNKRVRSTGFRFVATPETERLTAPPADGNPVTPQAVRLFPWHAGIRRANRRRANGRGRYSEILPLTNDGEMTALGQRYYGPSLVIVDALTFSAAEMFAAGFQDNRIGRVLCAGDTRTAGAGAWVWALDELRKLLGAGDGGLLAGSMLQFSALQCVRIQRGGRGFGRPFEGTGIEADIRHLLTEEDVHQHAADLLVTAADVLAREGRRPRPHLAVRKRTLARGEIEVTVEGKNVRELRVDIARFVGDEIERDTRRTRRGQLRLRFRGIAKIDVTGTDPRGREVHWKETFVP